MKLTIGLKIKWRLLGGFILCALFTGLAGGAGIMSIRQIQGNVKATTRDIGENIEGQTAMSARLMPLRGMVSDIVKAEDKGELEAKNRDVLEILNSGGSQGRGGLEKMIEAVEALVLYKGNQLGTLDRLSEMRRSNMAALEEVTKLAMAAVDDIEFESTMKIEKAVSKAGRDADRVLRITGEAISAVKGVLSLRSICNELSSLVKDALLTMDAAVVDYTSTQAATLFENARAELASLPNEETKAKIGGALDNLSSLVTGMLGAKKEMIAALNKLDDAYAAILGHMNKLDLEMIAASEKMKSSADSTLAKSTSLVNRWQYFLLLLSVGAFVLALAVGLFVSGSITRPITRAVSVFRAAESDSDLTRRLEAAASDEVGEMAESFNSFVGKLQAMIKGVAGEADVLSKSSAGLSGLSSKMSSGADNMSSRSKTVAAAAEEMSANMSSVAAAMEQAAANTSVVATAVEQMTSTIQEVSQNSEKARSITGDAVAQARSASERVDELGKAAGEIGKVTETITEISEQTNLLALNATIEAARAGEAGKGFAVVANEIKELARQTAAATEEIRKEIEGIQGSIGDTVSEIGQISDVINKVNEIVSIIAAAVEEQAITTREIADNVVQTTKGIQDASEKVAESSTVAGEMATDIAEVDNIVGEVSNSSSEVNASAGDLSGLAAKLTEMVGMFRV